MFSSETVNEEKSVKILKLVTFQQSNVYAFTVNVNFCLSPYVVEPVTATATSKHIPTDKAF